MIRGIMYTDLLAKLSIFLSKRVTFEEDSSSVESCLPSYWTDLLHNRVSVGEIVIKLWQGARNANYVQKLINNVQDIKIVCNAESKTVIGLGYVFSNPLLKGLPSVWLAYPPANSPEQQTFLKEFPQANELAAFLEIHNGFYLNGNRSIGIRSVGDLLTLQDSKGNKYLGFCGDGLGNFQCFPTMHKNQSEDILTFDWDHESQEASHPKKFSNFVEEFFQKEMGNNSQSGSI